MSKVAVWKETDFLKYKEQSYKKKNLEKFTKMRVWSGVMRDDRINAG